MSTHPKDPLDELELQFPPLPQSLVEAVELSMLPEGPELKQVVQMVERDPIILSMLLRIVNSAYYGQQYQITDPNRVVVILGPGVIVNLVMSMGMTKVIDAMTPTTTAAFLGYVRHSIAAAHLARHVAALNQTGRSEVLRQLPAESYAAALLHDLGKVVLLHSYPEKAAVLYLASARGHHDGRAAERAALGHDHVEAGVHLMQHLHTPLLAEVITLHHELDRLPAYDLVTQKLVYAVCAGNKAANALGYAFDRPVTWEACAQDAIWEQMHPVGYPPAAEVQEHVLSLQDDLHEYVNTLT